MGNYWERKWSRRRMLRGAGVAGMGTAGMALVGCGDDDDDGKSGGDTLS